ncbi:MAG: hypothetical protein HQL82_07530 [Magnetococcales bacterium]|nr:hypothetical protein [Magnetococcales bacterium]
MAKPRRKVLCVSPQFPPVNAADAHRLRLVLPYLKDHGLDATVLAVVPEQVGLDLDPLLVCGLPPEVPIIRVGALDRRWTSRVGLGNLGLRALPALLSTGSHLLQNQQMDLIYFSTTLFDCIPLGRYWKHRFKVPYAVDLQDPWRKDHYLRMPRSQRPRKLWFDYHLKALTEAISMPSVDGLTAVTADYLDQARWRYPSLVSVPMLELPFGAAEKDFEIARQHAPGNPIFTPGDGLCHIVSTGVVPTSFEPVLAALFLALSLLRREVSLPLQFHFVGTDYVPDPSRPRRVLPIAERFGVADLVREQTERLPYFQALHVMQEADILLLPGSSDSRYTPSKLYNYVLARRPILALFHEHSRLCPLFSATNTGRLVTFRDAEAPEQYGARIAPVLRSLLHDMTRAPDTNWDAIFPYTDAAMAKRLAAFFHEVVECSQGRKPVGITG